MNRHQRDLPPLQPATETSRLAAWLEQRLGLNAPYQIVPYRGFGTPNSLHLRGRVLRARALHPAESRASAWENLAATWQRIESDEVPGAEVELRLAGVTSRLVTDAEGFYSVTLVPELLSPDPWQLGDVTLRWPHAAPTVTAAVTALVPPAQASFGVISDIDDTVLVSDAANLLRAAQQLFLNNARQRLPFAGVDQLYAALQRGPGGAGHNPIFYVSSSPWNLYDLLSDFLALNDIPAGPLFLRDYELDRTLLSWGDHHKHKQEQIERLLATYPSLPFVLIGDSGQQDPEIYLETVRRHPGRFRAVFIRDVAGQERDSQVALLAAESTRLGAPTFLVADSAAAAAQAHGLQLIA